MSITRAFGDSFTKRRLNKTPANFTCLGSRSLCDITLATGQDGASMGVGGIAA